ncbi:protein kinase TDA1 NDAI_0C03610 [Naumovozyma dairenensis CBS 421]|uniref:Protein kinase domain-containing protein n=1 Tax=Naumovozyma dairenensis (strain ATCC 10597 / BCRC 20456 / CBS 421 / NBRC 0211 / NRRL Y-12639) TaxID=1071378 RepID=G0W8B0_NAUDC|nr:hypothetical protein NDAI_0C03610 [Naumovozyma dairenensis CBS 421]CCD24021.1 hypothetical protein NDAI_0C03610 [Naumovozyma dairenensis CBS 421]
MLHIQPLTSMDDPSNLNTGSKEANSLPKNNHLPTPPTSSDGTTTTEVMTWPNLSHNEKAFKCKYVTKHNSQLGDGNFSIVKECINIQTKDHFAMKLINKKIVKGKIKLIQREFKLLKFISEEIRSVERVNMKSQTQPSSLRINSNKYTNANANVNTNMYDTFDGHHHILQLFDFFETKDSIVLITQLCQKDDLYELIIQNEKLDLKRQVVPFTACLLSALQFLHSHGIVHRDIKAENVLFRLNPTNTNGDMKIDQGYDLMAHDLILADFGLATQLDSSSLKEYVGTISYIAPEIVKCKGVEKMNADELNSLTKYSYPVDIWALGVLTYFMALGFTPFDCENDEETLDCISKCDYYVDDDMLHDPTLKEFWSFIQCCFTKDVANRPTAFDLKYHPFLMDHFKSSLNKNLMKRPQALLGSQFHSQSQLNLRARGNGNDNSSTTTSNINLQNILVVEDQQGEELLDTPAFLFSSLPMVRNKSSSSLHSLKSPSRSKINSNSSSTTSLSSLISATSESFNNGNSSSSSCSMTTTHPKVQKKVTKVHPAKITNTTPSKFELSDMHVKHNLIQASTNKQEKNLDKIRDTLRRTLSMTSLRQPLPPPSASSNNKAGTLTSSTSSKLLKKNSTFVLDPKPPASSLMNGCFSTTPEAISNFTTPKELSRQSSFVNNHKSMTANIVANSNLKQENKKYNANDNANANDNDNDDEDEDEDDDNDDAGIYI